MRNRVSSFRYTIFLVSSASQQDVIMDISRGTISSFVLHWQLFSVVLNESLLDLFWRLHVVANTFSGYWLHALNKRIRFYHLLNDSADGSDRIWKPNRICVQCEQRILLRGFESRLTSPAEVIHSGHVSPWWRKPNDAGQLSTEDTLSLFVRVLQMKLGSELSWRRFYTRAWN